MQNLHVSFRSSIRICVKLAHKFMKIEGYGFSPVHILQGIEIAL
jgi:hypothetical protein